MNPPTEQLIRDYLNRLSVAARGKLGFAQRQLLLDRTRARIEAECGGTTGASAADVRKALASLGDPIVLVELEVGEAGSGTSTAGARYEPSVAGNGHREMAAERPHLGEVTKGSHIGEDLLATGGPNGSKPGRNGGSLRSLLAGLVAGQRRRGPGASSEPITRSTPRQNSGGRPGGRSSRFDTWPESRHDRRSGEASGAGPGTVSPIPAPRRPAASEKIGGPAPGQPTRRAVSGPVGPGLLGQLIRGVWGVTREYTVEVLATLLLGVGGAAYPPIWLIGAALGLPSKKWDIRDKFVGITLPVFLLIIGTVLIIVLGGQQASITAYAIEAWRGAGRLSRVLAAAGALYLAWRLRRGRREPKQPPWNRAG